MKRTQQLMRNVFLTCIHFIHLMWSGSEHLKVLKNPLLFNLSCLCVQRGRERSGAVSPANSLNLNVNTTVHLDVIHLMFVPFSNYLFYLY